MRAFPDQVGYCRKGSDRRGEAKFALASGGEAMARDESLRLEPGYYLLLELLDQKNVQGFGGLPRVTSLFPLDPASLLEGPARLLREEENVSFDDERQKLSLGSRLKYGELLVSEGDSMNEAGRAKGKKLMLEKAHAAGLSAFCAEGQPARYLNRRKFAGIDSPGEEAMWAVIDQAIESGAQSFAELRGADPLARVLDAAGHDARKLLDINAPKSLKLPSGREVSITYEEGKEPWIASRMQDFFGLKETPKIGPKRTPLTLHLLAPNQRAQQVTSDLAGFWEREYPKIRKELMRKYPKHQWPEEPPA
jgi:ATP-dependent helicase HrpB